MKRAMIARRVVIDHELEIDIQLSNTGSCTFGVIDVVRSGSNDQTGHPYPEHHTVREPLQRALVESTSVSLQGGAEPTQEATLVADEER
jgi:hypothetical protein